MLASHESRENIKVLSAYQDEILNTRGGLQKLEALYKTDEDDPDAAAMVASSKSILSMAL